MLEQSHMRTKARFSCWLKAAAILAVAKCAGVTDAQAQFDASRFRYDKYRGSLFDPLGWERERRKVHRRSDSSRVSPRVKARSKPEESERTTSKGVGTTVVTEGNVPLPRPRPPLWPEPRTLAEAAGPGFDSQNVTGALSDCDQRLTEIAAIELLPRLLGPGDCGGRDMIRLEAVLLPNRKRVEIRPTAVLRCPMAESFAAWVRDEASDHLGAQLATRRWTETCGSDGCRGRRGRPAARP